MPLINGKQLAATHLQRLKKEIIKHKATPCLGIIMVGDDERSAVYVRNKQRRAQKVGINTRLSHLPAHVSQEELRSHIKALNEDKSVNGIILQLPIPQHLSPQELLEAIAPEKDVDGLHPLNIGRLRSSGLGIKPCTPKGIMSLIHTVSPTIAGKLAVVIGRSDIVGKPIATLLMHSNATVIHAHSRTQNLHTLTKQADIVVTAVGKPGLLNATHFKDGAIVIDVGISAIDGKLHGDVEMSDELANKTHVTPVPGGVGPMTIANLLENTYEAYKMQVAHDR